MVDLRINETLQTGAVRNRTYRSPVWYALFPTAPMRCGEKPHLPGWIECDAGGNRTYRGADVSIYLRGVHKSLSCGSGFSRFIRRLGTTSELAAMRDLKC